MLDTESGAVYKPPSFLLDPMNFDPTQVAPRAIDVPPGPTGCFAVFFQGIYSILGLVVGVVCVLGGIVLFIHGITGSSSWVVKFLGLESNISDAAPGVILFIVGLFIVFITRYVVTVRDKK
jgi:hypothetical protein